MHVTSERRPKGYRLNDFNHATPQERQEDCEPEARWLPVVGRDGRVTGRSTGGVQGNETPLCDTVTADTCHHAFVQTYGMHDTESEL